MPKQRLGIVLLCLATITASVGATLATVILSVVAAVLIDQ